MTKKKRTPDLKQDRKLLVLVAITLAIILGLFVWVEVSL